MAVMKRRRALCEYVCTRVRVSVVGALGLPKHSAHLYVSVPTTPCVCCVSCVCVGPTADYSRRCIASAAMPCVCLLPLHLLTSLLPCLCCWGQRPLLASPLHACACGVS